jgi:hypothetical protein
MRLTVFFCCGYCLKKFALKDHLYSHWFNNCLKYCDCINCQQNVWAEVDYNFVNVYFFRHNLSTSVFDVVKQYFPQNLLDYLYQINFEGYQHKLYREDSDVEMEQV